METFKKENAKTKRMILDGFKDHNVPHIAKKGRVKEIWDAIVKLYQDPIENRKIILKERLRTIKMHTGPGSYKK